MAGPRSAAGGPWPAAPAAGEIEGCPFYTDSRLSEAWNKAELTLDVGPGEPEGFSLGPGDGMHFAVRSGACAAEPAS
jgi:uncharacterized protein (DUF779 family)